MKLGTTHHSAWPYAFLCVDKKCLAKVTVDYGANACPQRINRRVYEKCIGQRLYERMGERAGYE